MYVRRLWQLCRLAVNLIKRRSRVMKEIIEFFIFFQLFQLLVPKEKYDGSPVILEVTAGRTTGGQQSPYSEDYFQPPSNSIKPLMGYS